MIGSHFHRQALAALVYITDTLALVSALAIVKLNPGLIGASVGIIVFGFSFFGLLTYLGHRLMHNIAEDEVESKKFPADKTPGDQNGADIATFCASTTDKNGLDIATSDV